MESQKSEEDMAFDSRCRASDVPADFVVRGLDEAAFRTIVDLYEIPGADEFHVTSPGRYIQEPVSDSNGNLSTPITYDDVSFENICAEESTFTLSDGCYKLSTNDGPDEGRVFCYDNEDGIGHRDEQIRLYTELGSNNGNVHLHRWAPEAVYYVAAFRGVIITNKISSDIDETLPVLHIAPSFIFTNDERKTLAEYVKKVAATLSKASDVREDGIHTLLLALSGSDLADETFNGAMLALKKLGPREVEFAELLEMARLYSAAHHNFDLLKSSSSMTRDNPGFQTVRQQIYEVQSGLDKIDIRFLDPRQAALLTEFQDRRERLMGELDELEGRAPCGVGQINKEGAACEACPEDQEPNSTKDRCVPTEAKCRETHGDAHKTDDGCRCDDGYLYNKDNQRCEAPEPSSSPPVRRTVRVPAARTTVRGNAAEEDAPAARPAAPRGCAPKPVKPSGAEWNAMGPAGQADYKAKLKTWNDCQ